MNKVKPNYIEPGLSSSMGKQLRSLVEQQLITDLEFYGIDKPELKFDWSESCIEGHQTDYLDGSVENFSGIAVFDNKDNFIAEGYMDFIHDTNLFLAYWELVSTWNKDEKLMEKTKVGIPDHIWDQIPDDIKPTYEKFRMKRNIFQN